MGSRVAVRDSTTVREPGFNHMISSDYSRLQASDRGVGDPATTRHDSFLLTPAAKKWIRNYWQPYRGFTSDGTIHPVWQANPIANGPTQDMVLAARKLLSVATVAERQRFRYLVTAREWRAWSDPDVSQYNITNGGRYTHPHRRSL